MLRAAVGRLVCAATNVTPRSSLARPARLMSSHTEETDEEFDCRMEAYLNRTDIDGWELRGVLNDMASMDMVPEPKIIIAALKACRRINDFALTVRWLETVRLKSKVDKAIYPYILQEIRPTLDELGVNTPEELGYDKPELALQDVNDIN